MPVARQINFSEGAKALKTCFVVHLKAELNTTEILAMVSVESEHFKVSLGGTNYFCNDFSIGIHFSEKNRFNTVCKKGNGSRVGLVVRALAFHQCGPGSISALGVMCGLSLLLLYSALRGFCPGTPVFPSHQKPTFDLT